MRLIFVDIKLKNVWANYFYLILFVNFLTSISLSFYAYSYKVILKPPNPFIAPSSFMALFDKSLVFSAGGGLITLLQLLSEVQMDQIWNIQNKVTLKSQHSSIPLVFMAVFKIEFFKIVNSQKNFVKISWIVSRVSRNSWWCEGHWCSSTYLVVRLSDVSSNTGKKCIFGVFRLFLRLCRTASQPYRLSYINALCINYFY
jgi:hypothetical protein